MNTEKKRHAPLDMSSPEFRELGHELVDQIADFLDSLPQRPVNHDEGVREIRNRLGGEGLPEDGTPASEILNGAFQLLVDHSLFNGHPRFWGYITASGAPIGALADMLAASINPNLGAWQLSPMSSEIELQTVRWIADLIGYPQDCGGVLVSGGNMANFVGFLVGRKHKIPGDVRRQGVHPETGRPRVYCSAETHTWIEKAADLYGMGTDAIRWIPTDSQQRMDPGALIEQIAADKEAGDLPLIVVGTAGSVSTGAIDPLPKIAQISKEYDLWFHVDGAYGGFAACLPEAPEDLKGLSLADSVAIDPHKWLYQPLEAGCALVRDPKLQEETFSYHPVYYRFEDVDEEEIPINLHSYSPQNSRGFRALKVWMSLRQAGRSGYQGMIRDDIALANHLYKILEAEPELEPVSQSLSITTFRYVPEDLDPEDEVHRETLNELNGELLTELQRRGEMFVSNALIEDQFLLRACVVNFRTDWHDIEAVPEIILRTGREVYASMQK